MKGTNILSAYLPLMMGAFSTRPIKSVNNKNSYEHHLSNETVDKINENLQKAEKKEKEKRQRKMEKRLRDSRSQSDSKKKNKSKNKIWLG